MLSFYSQQSKEFMRTRQYDGEPPVKTIEDNDNCNLKISVSNTTNFFKVIYIAPSIQERPNSK
jgi:hypothetical protein